MRIRKTLGSIPGGAALCFFLQKKKNTAQFDPAVRKNTAQFDPAVSSSIFVGAEREVSLIRNDPDNSEFTILVFLFSG